jgi:hypothetical protein
MLALRAAEDLDDVERLAVLRATSGGLSTA